MAIGIHAQAIIKLFLETAGSQSPLLVSVFLTILKSSVKNARKSKRKEEGRKSRRKEGKKRRTENGRNDRIIWRCFC